MPKQKGVLKLEGTISNLTFYRIRNNYYVRERRRIIADPVLNDPRFARQRENASEFGEAVKAGKLLRDTVKPMFKEAGCRRTSESMLQLMLNIQKLDTVSERGKRNIVTALLHDEAKHLFTGFEFNTRSHLKDIVLKTVDLNPVNGEVTIADLVTQRDIKRPEGATHISLRSAYANVNFSNSTRAIEYSNEVTLSVDLTPVNVVLTPSAIPPGSGTKFYFLRILFLQQVSGSFYELKEGAFHAMTIIEVK